MSILKVDEIKGADGGNTALVNGAYVRTGIIDPDNKIINGAFDFWQRGISFNTMGYGPDRWLGSQSGGTCVYSRQDFPLGTKLGNNNPTYFLRYSVSGHTLANNYAAPFQPIENVSSYAGQTITVLGWARRSSGSGNMTVEMAQIFGTGGTPSSMVTGIGVKPVSLTSSWQPFAATIDVPSVSGKTIGTNNDDWVGLVFWLSAGSTYSARSGNLGFQTLDVDFWGIHIKVGTHTTDACDLYYAPNINDEAIRCYRYYYTSVRNSTNNSYLYTNVAAANQYCRRMVLPVPMRKIPTISFTTPTYVNASTMVATAEDNSSWLETVTSLAAGGYGASGYTVTFNAEF